MKRFSSPTIQPFLLFAYLLLLSTYFLVRFEGNWGETDSIVLTRLIKFMVESGDLIPHAEAYQQGYGYPTIATFLLTIAGSDPIPFQKFVVPLLLCWIALPTWLLYRELLRHNSAATLASILLLIQPELLFVLLRSSHEKFSRGLMLFGFYLFARSLRTKRLQSLGWFIVAFYLACYGVIATNNLIATSYIVGIGLTLFGLYVMGELPFVRNAPVQLARRMRYVLATLFVMAIFFTFVIYTPATKNIITIQTAWERIASLFLEFTINSSSGGSSVNPYTVVGRDWPSTRVYLTLTLVNWISIAGSALIWLHLTWRTLWKRTQTLSQHEWLLWSLYGSFALLAALSILLDASGFLSSNLQLRIFPAFGTFAAPMMAYWLHNHRPQQRGKLKVYSFGVATGLMILALLSIFKATNEPLFANNWLFASDSELAGIRWADSHSVSNQVWVDYNERLRRVDDFDRLSTDLDNRNRFLNWFYSSGDVLLTEWVGLRSQRLDAFLPPTDDKLRVYDNGGAQFFHQRSRTPYEP